MKRLIVVMVIAIMSAGCSYGRQGGIYILNESEQYYLIPAGTPFNAVIQKGQPPIEIMRNVPTWAVDAGYLNRLQQEANAAVLEPRE